LQDGERKTQQFRCTPVYLFRRSDFYKLTGQKYLILVTSHKTWTIATLYH